MGVLLSAARGTDCVKNGVATTFVTEVDCGTKGGKDGNEGVRYHEG